VSAEAERSARLRANLAALAACAPRLAERLRWGVGSEHTRRVAGVLQLKVHRRWVALEPNDEARQRWLAGCPEGEPCLLFGVGEGSLVAPLLERAGQVVAWERDPWLLRQALSATDLTEPLRSGALRLALGIDLLDLPALRVREHPVVEHPVLEHPVLEHPVLEHPTLGPIYRRERTLLAPRPPAMALIADGHLMIDEVARALGRRGWGAYTLDTAHLSRPEMGEAITRSRASLVVSINHVPGLAELAADHDLPLLTWQIDPALAHPRPLRRPAPRAHVFVHRRACADAYRAAGFQGVTYLPLAADTRTRCPPSEAPSSEHAAPLSFVGQSLVSEVGPLRARFIELLGDWMGDPAAAARLAPSRLEEIHRVQRADFSRYRIPELLRAHFGRFVDDMAQRHPEIDLEILVAQQAASEKRLTWVSNLGRLDLGGAGARVWGDDGWRLTVPHGVSFAGRYAGHRSELSAVYAGSQINVDINRIYQPDIITLRVFDVLASGGFLLAEHSDALLELFEDGRELVVYRDLRQLLEKVRYYHDRPDERREIAAQGLQAVRERHDIQHRVDAALAAMELTPAC